MEYISKKFKFGSYFLVVSISFLFLISFVGAFGVGVFNSEGLKVYPGQIVENNFVIQNIIPEGGEDIVVQVELLEGSSIASFVDNALNYAVSNGQEVEVGVRIEVPEGVPIGTEYVVSAMFRQVVGGGGEGDVQFSTNIRKSFSVLVVDESEAVESFTGTKGSGFLLWFVLLLIVLVFIIFIVIRLRKRKSVSVPSPNPN